MEANKESVKPILTLEKVKELVKSFYNLEVHEIKEFVGYDDCNFYCKVKNSDNQTTEMNFKVTNHVDSNFENLLESLNHLSLYLFDKKINIPVPLKNLNGNYLERIHLSHEDRKNAIRLFTYIPGTILENVTYTSELLEDTGFKIAQLSKALMSYKNENIEKRKFLWSLESVLEIRKYIDAVKDEARICLVKKVLDRFENEVLNKKDIFIKSIIHGDLNTYNLLVDNNTLSGILDLGDVHYSLRIFDIAIFCAYCMIKTNDTSLDIFEMPKLVLKNYIKEMNLTEQELEIIQICIMARICQSLVLGTYFFQFNPSNTYLLKSTINGWTVLERLTLEKLNLK